MIYIETEARRDSDEQRLSAYADNARRKSMEETVEGGIAGDDDKG